MTKVIDRTIHNSREPLTCDCPASISDLSKDHSDLRFLGVLAREESHCTLGSVVDISYETPYLTTACYGFYLAAGDDIDSEIRAKLVDIALRCKERADALTRHHDKLMEIALGNSPVLR